MGLAASVFSPEFKVPDKHIAETPELHKKISSVRGTASRLRRKLLIKDIAKKKKQSTNKLAYGVAHRRHRL